MFVGYATEVSGSVLPEAFWRAFKGKLDAVGCSARILLGKRASQVVEYIAEAVRKFANDNTDFSAKNIARFRKEDIPLLVGGEIRIGVNDVLLEPFQVFLCPREESFDFLELIEHAAFLASSEQACP
jgi:hypothetical protein